MTGIIAFTWCVFLIKWQLEWGNQTIHPACIYKIKTITFKVSLDYVNMWPESSICCLFYFMTWIKVHFSINDSIQQLLYLYMTLTPLIINDLIALLFKVYLSVKAVYSTNCSMSLSLQEQHMKETPKLHKLHPQTSHV